MPKWGSDWFDSWAERKDRRKGWDKVSKPVGLALLRGIQHRLRRRNLHDTDSIRPVAASLPASPPEGALTGRTIDGTFNDLQTPAMGSAGTRFGRNVPLKDAFPEPEDRMLVPDPRVVSRELLTRDSFQPATTLNLLAAAWIQFEVHDWVDHGKPDWDTAYRFALQTGDPWPEDPLRIPRTRRDPSWTGDRLPPTFVTADSHWWDGSQVYGNDPTFASAIRTGDAGKLKVGADGLPPPEVAAHVDLSGVAGNFWVGLALLHGLFMHEHNAICDMLRGEHPDWSDDQLYAKARLINAALMAKIHTVEWTPAIIAHPTSQAAMRIDWWGLVGQRAVRRFGHFSRWDLLTGTPGSKKNHDGVPYTLTEEFTAVYRLHPLIPDEFTFRSPDDDRVLAEHPFPDLGVLHVRDRMAEIGLAGGFYSFGVSNPGAIQLHNFPKFLQEFHRADGTITDLAAIDVLRIRERGVPRYNRFRELFHKAPVRTFEQLTPNRQWQEELRSVYGSVDEVDLMIGMYAEAPPKGFGFSDTAFRVFALRAPRRVKSDRFLTTDYTPKMYTPAGLKWIDDTTMVTLLLRHFPELGPSLQGVTNAFAPWNRVRP
jgi:hypothetical protein